MGRRAKPHPTKLPPIAPGSWCGELLGGATVNLGQAVQPGPPKLSVEFSQIIAPVALTMPDGSFTWPGALFIMAPTRMKPESADAGVLLTSSLLPSLCLTLDVTREQFSDVLHSMQSNRFKRFHFAVGEFREGTWPVTSWGAIIELDMR